MAVYNRFPMIFDPAFKIQDNLRKRTLGVSTWRSMIDKFDATEKAKGEGKGRSLHDQLTEIGLNMRRAMASAGKKQQKSKKK